MSTVSYEKRAFASRLSVGFLGCGGRTRPARRLYGGMHSTPYWLIDDSHGWLVVSLSVVVASGAEITRFSYVSPTSRLAYLEEDCDARAFLDAARIERAIATAWPIKRVKRAHCRQYPPFPPGGIIGSG